VAADRTTQAEVLLRQALEIFQRISAAEAAQVSAALDALIQADHRVDIAEHRYGYSPERPQNGPRSL
jgi:hypothetical protein